MRKCFAPGLKNHLCPTVPDLSDISGNLLFFLRFEFPIVEKVTKLVVFALDEKGRENSMSDMEHKSSASSSESGRSQIWHGNSGMDAV
jgi:hypothetical protein